MIPLTWDVTVVSTLGDSYLHSTSHSAGSAAETASIRKETKYSSLPPDHIFQPVATETLGPLNASGSKLLKRGGSPVDFFIWRFTRDLISVPAPLNAHSVRQLCSDYGLLLL